ncbi:MAG: hypothetical protein DME22_06245 [Verrucomicrobia bacterium]|nr:MAG: hypothetical protein DME22_06245 [Verrucomicrobiota bacterium]
MKHSLTVLLFLAGVGTVHPQWIDDDWIFSVAYIGNESTGGGGTGFFVSREFETNKNLIFLVSNRHVLAPKDTPPGETNRLAKAKVVITREENGQLSTGTLDITLREPDGISRVVPHPNTNIDVAVVDVTAFVIENRGIRKGYKVGVVREDRFASMEIMTNTHVTIGQQIVFLGYPLNLIEGKTAIAVARGGVIATPPDRDFKTQPVFLVDSATIRGSSGSPVFLPLRSYKIERQPDGNRRINTMSGYTPCLLGIVVATVPDWELIVKKTDTFGLEPSAISVVATANFGVVFRAGTISETLDATGTAKVQSKGQTEF